MAGTKKQKQQPVKSGQPPPVDKLMKPAIGVALAIVGYQFFRGLGADVSVFLPVSQCLGILLIVLDPYTITKQQRRP